MNIFKIYQIMNSSALLFVKYYIIFRSYFYSFFTKYMHISIVPRLFVFSTFGGPSVDKNYSGCTGL